MVFDKTRTAVRNRLSAAKNNTKEVFNDSKDRSFTEAVIDLAKNDGQANRQFIKDLRR
jgi:hypothetical protein